MDGQTLAANDLLEEIFLLEKAVLSLKAKVLKALPVKYGSEAWWEKEAEEGIKSIELGRGKKFATYEEAVKYLNG